MRILINLKLEIKL